MDRTWTQDTQGPRYDKMIKTSSIGCHVVEGDPDWNVWIHKCGARLLFYFKISIQTFHRCGILYSQMLIQTFAMCHNPCRLQLGLKSIFLSTSSFRLCNTFSQVSYFSPNFIFFSISMWPSHRLHTWHLVPPNTLMFYQSPLDTWCPQILWCSINHHSTLGAPKYFDVSSITTYCIPCINIDYKNFLRAL